MAGKRRLSGKAVRNLEGSMFILPWMLGFTAFMAFPLVFSFYMSFHNIKVLPDHMQYRFVGLQYFKEILMNSSALYDNLIPFFQEVLIMVPVILVFSLLTAILLNQELPGRFLFRAVFFLPVIFSTGYVLTEFVNQGDGSLGFLDRFELGTYLDQFLGSSSWTNPIKEVLNRFVLVLWYSGVQILLFLAGRQSITSSAYESARIDGASPWEVFWKITFPAMSPYILLNLIYTVVDMFTFPFNPVIWLINTGQGAYGYNSAMSWIYFLIIILFLSLVLILYNRVIRKTLGTRN